MAGPAHGLHMYESEGEGLGRCMFVLMGGRSGGHQAAVLASVKCSIYLYLTQHLIYKILQAFHPELPLIATCGVRLFPAFLIIYSQLMSIVRCRWTGQSRFGLYELHQVWELDVKTNLSSAAAAYTRLECFP